MENSKIAQIFQEISEMLEIKGENRFKVNSYARASQVIASYPHDLFELWSKDRKNLMKIPSIGQGLAEKIEEMLLTGKLEYYEKLLKGFPKGMLEMLNIRGIGPKKVKLFYDNLRIDDLDKLKKAAEKHLVQKLPGMGPKSEDEILHAIEEYRGYHKRILLSTAMQIAEKYLAYLRKSKDIKRAEYAGSLRRKRETIGDLDILVIGHEHDKIIEYFCSYDQAKKIIARGPKKASVILNYGIQVDLRVLDESQFGAALHYFTGSKEHNIAMRDRAKRMGFKLSEYGLFKNSHTIGGKTEKEVFENLDLRYIEPELRENKGEIEAAEKEQLPDLIQLKDLKGDFHVHTNWSDGVNTVLQMAEAAKAFGLEYIAISDHSGRLKVANGLDPARIKQQWKEIDEANKKIKDFTILKGTEVDILEDGSLDFPDEILARLDVVIASVHSKFRLPIQEQTQRVIKAFQNPYVKIFGHPSARLINKREAISLDMEKIIFAAKDYNVALEINANPQRLDLTDYYAKLAKELGVKMAIGSDSHDISGFENLKYGVYVAKRGWLEKKNIINALNLENIKKTLKNK